MQKDVTKFKHDTRFTRIHTHTHNTHKHTQINNGLLDMRRSRHIVRSSLSLSLSLTLFSLFSLFSLIARSPFFFSRQLEFHARICVPFCIDRRARRRAWKNRSDSNNHTDAYYYCASFFLFLSLCSRMKNTAVSSPRAVNSIVLHHPGATWLFLALAKRTSVPSLRESNLWTFRWKRKRSITSSSTSSSRRSIKSCKTSRACLTRFIN